LIVTSAAKLVWEKSIRAIVTALTLTLFAATSHAEPAPPTSQEIAAFKAHNEDIVARSPHADGVFVVQGDGTIKHVQSGMVCAANFTNVNFWHSEVFDDGKGLDVGCDYGRNGADGKWISKLTIFAVKSPEGATLDNVFAHYKQEIERTYPAAVALAPALQMNSKMVYRAQGYTVAVDGGNRHEELIVGLTNGWTIEVRASYPHAGIVVKDANDKTDLKNQLFDIESPYLSFMAAVTSLEEAARSAGPSQPSTLGLPQNH
jgi:hypothetical protein